MIVESPRDINLSLIEVKGLGQTIAPGGVVGFSTIAIKRYWSSSFLDRDR